MVDKLKRKPKLLLAHDTMLTCGHYGHYLYNGKNIIVKKIIEIKFDQ